MLFAVAYSGEGSKSAVNKDDWKSSVSALWIETMESDMKTQESEPEQPPFSQAYFISMPAIKRRKVIQGFNYLHSLGWQSHIFINI